MNDPITLILSDACADEHECAGRCGTEDAYYAYAEWMGSKSELSAWENFMAAPTAESMAEEDRARQWDSYYGPDEYLPPRTLEVVIEEESANLPMWLINVSHAQADLISRGRKVLPNPTYLEGDDDGTHTQLRSAGRAYGGAHV